MKIWKSVVAIVGFTISMQVVFAGWCSVKHELECCTRWAYDITYSESCETCKYDQTNYYIVDCDKNVKCLGNPIYNQQDKECKRTPC